MTPVRSPTSRSRTRCSACRSSCSALCRDELHGRTLHRFGNRLGVAIIVLFTLAIRAHVFRRHQAGIVAKRLKFPTEMMRADAGFHPDQARLHIGEARFDLAARSVPPIQARKNAITFMIPSILP